MGLLKKKVTVHINIHQSAQQEEDTVNYEKKLTIGRVGGNRVYPTHKRMLEQFLANKNHGARKITGSQAMKMNIQQAMSLHDYTGRTRNWGYTHKYYGTTTQLNESMILSAVGGDSISEYAFSTDSALYNTYLLQQSIPNVDINTMTWTQKLTSHELEILLSEYYVPEEKNTSTILYTTPTSSQQTEQAFTNKIRGYVGKGALENAIDTYLKSYNKNSGTSFAMTPKSMSNNLYFTTQGITGGTRHNLKTYDVEFKWESRSLEEYATAFYNEYTEEEIEKLVTEADPTNIRYLQFLRDYQIMEDIENYGNSEMLVTTIEYTINGTTLNIDLPADISLSALGYPLSYDRYKDHFFSSVFEQDYRKKYGLSLSAEVDSMMDAMTFPGNDEEILDALQNGSALNLSDPYTEVELTSMVGDNEVNYITLQQYLTREYDNASAYIDPDDEENNTTKEEQQEKALIVVRNQLLTVAVEEAQKDYSLAKKYNISQFFVVEDDLKKVSIEMKIEDIKEVLDNNPDLKTIRIPEHVEHTMEFKVPTKTLQYLVDKVADNMNNPLIVKYVKNGQYYVKVLTDSNRYYVSGGIADDFVSWYVMVPYPTGKDEPYWNYTNNMAVKRNKKTTEDVGYINKWLPSANDARLRSKELRGDDLAESLLKGSYGGCTLHTARVYQTLDLVPYFLKSVRDNHAYQVMLRNLHLYFMNQCKYGETLSQSVGVRYNMNNSVAYYPKQWWNIARMAPRFFTYGLYWKGAVRTVEGKYKDKCYIGNEAGSGTQYCLYLNEYTDSKENKYTQYVLDFYGFLTYGTYQLNLSGGSLTKASRLLRTFVGKLAMYSFVGPVAHFVSEVVGASGDPYKKYLDKQKYKQEQHAELAQDVTVSYSINQIPGQFYTRTLQNRYNQLKLNIVSPMPLKAWWRIPYISKCTIHAYSIYYDLYLTKQIKVSTWLGDFLGFFMIVIGVVLVVVGAVSSSFTGGAAVSVVAAGISMISGGIAYTMGNIGITGWIVNVFQGISAIASLVSAGAGLYAGVAGQTVNGWAVAASVLSLTAGAVNIYTMIQGWNYESQLKKAQQSYEDEKERARKEIENGIEQLQYFFDKLKMSYEDFGEAMDRFYEIATTTLLLQEETYETPYSDERVYAKMDRMMYQG